MDPSRFDEWTAGMPDDEVTDLHRVVDGLTVALADPSPDALVAYLASEDTFLADASYEQMCILIAVLHEYGMTPASPVAAADLPGWLDVDVTYLDGICDDLDDVDDLDGFDENAVSSGRLWRLSVHDLD